MTEVTKEMLQAALEVDAAYARDAEGNLYARMYLAMRDNDEEFARLRGLEAELEETILELQKIGERFGVLGGEKRTAGIARILEGNAANLAQAVEIMRPFAKWWEDSDAMPTAGNVRAARAFVEKHGRKG